MGLALPTLAGKQTFLFLILGTQTMDLLAAISVPGLFLK
jgi:hypothetical protein